MHQGSPVFGVGVGGKSQHGLVLFLSGSVCEAVSIECTMCMYQCKYAEDSTAPPTLSPLDMPLRAAQSFMEGTDREPPRGPSRSHAWPS